ncbi:hypothetical protein IPC1180_32485 [Pseudomonas aeruginosa]|nr:hypothetical protein IPC1180_32485 [Pseudomonas aeruginosa]
MKRQASTAVATSAATKANVGRSFPTTNIPAQFMTNPANQIEAQSLAFLCSFIFLCLMWFMVNLGIPIMAEYATGSQKGYGAI